MGLQPMRGVPDFLAMLESAIGEKRQLWLILHRPEADATLLNLVCDYRIERLAPANLAERAVVLNQYFRRLGE